MATIIRPKLSKKNKYYVDEHRYYELKHFCLQYRLWKERCRDLLVYGKNDVSEVYVKEVNLGDPTYHAVERRESYLRKIELVEKVAYKADPELYRFILKAVTEDLSYNNLKTMLDIPCGRDMYYDRYRKFFWLLDQERDQL